MPAFPSPPSPSSFHHRYVQVHHPRPINLRPPQLFHPLLSTFSGFFVPVHSACYISVLLVSSYSYIGCLPVCLEASLWLTRLLEFINGRRCDSEFPFSPQSATCHLFLFKGFLKSLRAIWYTREVLIDRGVFVEWRRWQFIWSPELLKPGLRLCSCRWVVNCTCFWFVRSRSFENPTPLWGLRSSRCLAFNSTIMVSQKRVLGKICLVWGLKVSLQPQWNCDANGVLHESPLGSAIEGPRAGFLEH